MEIRIRTACVLIFMLLPLLVHCEDRRQPESVRILVVTGGHDFNRSTFSEMMNSLGDNISWTSVTFPEAYDRFLPENRKNYDVLVFYHMWQTITPDQEATLKDCISSGMPVVALHHSICAFDNWEDYWRILGGKYFHSRTVFDGKVYEPGSYIHDLHFRVQVADKKHPVLKNVNDFEIFDETYKGYWVDPAVTILLTTDESTSNQVIGWTKDYGKAKIVVLQSGHDTPTFNNTAFRQILRQAILFVTGESKYQQ